MSDDIEKKRPDLKDLFSKGKDFLDMYSKVAEFTRELMSEHEKLQQRINELMEDREDMIHDGSQDPEETILLRRIEDLKNEKQDILNHYYQVEAENKDFQKRYYDIENENNNLANLYVASYQLHSTLDLAEVLDIISEIIINLIGAQAFGILMINEKKARLEPMKSEGIPLEALPTVRLGEGVIGEVAERGEIFFRQKPDRDKPFDPLTPLVALPLKINEEIIGVIVIFELLSQKVELVKMDYDLFSLLAAHAATALFSAKLYGDSIRKQNTIKGFLDLLTH